MKIYSAIKVDNENIKFYGSMRKLAKDIGVSAMYVSKCFNDNKIYKGFDILFCLNYPHKVKLTQKEKLHILINTLERAKLIIDEQNKLLSESNQYSSVNIIADIDRALSYYKKG